MIAHAWTTLCDRVVIDRESDNLSLDTIEVIYVNRPDNGQPTLVPCRLEVVSLWYRRESDAAELARANVCVLSPSLEVIARLPIEIDLRSARRLRTRTILDGLLVHRPGTYLIALDVLDATPAREVARIPLEVEFVGG
jgi:hypothetical protein